jgi:hypothetical protein
MIRRTDSCRSQQQKLNRILKYHSTKRTVRRLMANVGKDHCWVIYEPAENSKLVTWFMLPWNLNKLSSLITSGLRVVMLVWIWPSVCKRFRTRGADRGCIASVSEILSVFIIKRSTSHQCVELCWIWRNHWVVTPPWKRRKNLRNVDNTAYTSWCHEPETGCEILGSHSDMYDNYSFLECSAV